MSSSPSQAPTSGAGAANADQLRYRLGWAALNKLLRRGFSWSGHERHCAFLNTGRGRFADVSFGSGLDFPDDGRAAAVIDWDQDGDQDLFLTARNGPRLRYLQNGLVGGGGSVSLRLASRSKNRGAVGARVELELAAIESDEAAAVPAGKLVRTRRVGEGYLAQSSAWLHFGLGDRAVAGTVVRWPGGALERFEGVEANGHFVLVEGRGEALAWTLAQPPPLAPSPAVAEREQRDESACRIVLTEPVPMPSWTFEDASGTTQRMFGVVPGGAGRIRRPILVNVLASWCAPCREELEELHARAGDLRATGLGILALAAEDAGERTAVRELMETLEWDSPYGFAPPDTLALLDGFVGALLDRETPLTVPTSFLVDQHGRVVVVYVGRVRVDRLLADLSLFDADPAQRLAAAVPFRGRWLVGPAHLGARLIGERMRARGLTEAGDELALDEVEVVQTSRAEMLHGHGLRQVERGEIEAAIDYFRRALEADPQYFPGYRDLGIALHRRGRLALAVDLYRQALRLDPGAHQTRYNLGLALLSLGDRSAAAEAERRLREAESPLAAELLRQLGRFDAR